MVKPTGYITIPDAFGAAMKAEYHVQERDGGHIIFTGFPGVMAAYLEYFEKYAEEHLRFSSLLMQVKFRSDTVPVELLYTQSSPFDVLQDVTDWDPRARHPSETTAEVDWPRHLAADWVRHDQEAELATFYLDLRPMPPFLQARGHEWLIDTEVPDWAQPRESLTYWALPPTAIAFFALKDLAAFVVRKDDPAWHAQQDVDPEYRLCFLLRVLWALRSEATDKEHWINTGLWDDYLDDDIEHEITQRGDLKNLATRKATLKYLRNLEAGLGILKTVGLSEGGKSRQLALEEFGCVESTRRAQGAMHKDMLERRYREMFEGFTTLAQERINHFKVSRENIYKPQSSASTTASPTRSPTTTHQEFPPVTRRATAPELFGSPRTSPSAQLQADEPHRMTRASTLGEAPTSHTPDEDDRKGSLRRRFARKTCEQVKKVVAAPVGVFRSRGEPQGTGDGPQTS